MTTRAERSEVGGLLKKSMEVMTVGTGEKDAQNGRDFYRYFFTHYPQVRKHFKGAENYTGEDVQKSERFTILGQRMLFAMHIVVEIYENAEVFKAFIRELIGKYRVLKIDPALWHTFFVAFVGLIETKTKLDDATKGAWQTLGKAFNDEAQGFLKKHGLPHA